MSENQHMISYWQTRAESAERARDALLRGNDATLGLLRGLARTLGVVPGALTIDPLIGRIAEAAQTIDARSGATHQQLERKQAALEEARRQISELEAMSGVLRQAGVVLLNQLVVLRMPDESRLWQLGGPGLDRAYRALKAALECDAGRALLAELDAARALAETLRTQMPALARGDGPAWQAIDQAMEAYEAAGKGAT